MKRSKHNLSFYRLASFDMGQLVPVGITEVLPGDSFRAQSSALIRVAPLVAPVMHPVHVRLHHWFVPNRILWDGWEKFISGQNVVDDVPTITLASNFTLSDHMGLPKVTNLEVNALPFRAYNKIWNEFYRDQDLDTEVLEDDLALLDASWEKDYFTICRAQPQAGDDITIPFSVGEIPIKGIGEFVGDAAYSSNNNDVRTPGGITIPSSTQQWSSSSGDVRFQEDPDNSGFPDVRADLSDATAGISVQDWRESMAKQRFAEARNRFGSRYTDYLRFLGVRPSDARLDRPEYLGGGRQTISFSEVLQTAPEAASSSNVGELSGHGIAAVRSRPHKRFFEEHGYHITLMSARPKTMYMDHVPRHYLRETKDDFWQRENEIQGDQAVTNLEVWGPAQGGGSETAAFGYVPRHDEYRRAQSQVSGDFRESQANFWHMAREFGAQPVLNASFVSCDPTDRIYADTTEPELKCMIRNRIAARRLVGKNARF